MRTTHPQRSSQTSLSTFSRVNGTGVRFYTSKQRSASAPSQSSGCISLGATRKDNPTASLRYAFFLFDGTSGTELHRTSARASFFIADVAEAHRQIHIDRRRLAFARSTSKRLARSVSRAPPGYAACTFQKRPPLRGICSSPTIASARPKGTSIFRHFWFSSFSLQLSASSSLGPKPQSHGSDSNQSNCECPDEEHKPATSLLARKAWVCSRKSHDSRTREMPFLSPSYTIVSLHLRGSVRIVPLFVQFLFNRSSWRSGVTMTVLSR